VIDLQEHPEGTILPVRAHAGARRNKVEGKRAGSLLVSVTAAPEKGLANKAIIALLAGALELRKSQLVLLAGQTSAQKRFLVRDISPTALGERIQKALA
jgi:uncharacterized protein YggU (UPF0235/DUF167 family)